MCQAGIYLDHTNQISAELHHEERHDQRLPKEDERSARGAGASADQGPHESSFRAPPNRVKQGRWAGDSLRDVYFYDRHEADDELAIGLTLAHDEAFAPSEFLAMVETARSRVIETFTEETLIEAIAAELEREHDFAASLDSRLVAAVGISSEEGETRLLAHEGEGAHAADEGEEEDPDLAIAEALLSGREPIGLRTAVVDLEKNESLDS